MSQQILSFSLDHNAVSGFSDANDNFDYSQFVDNMSSLPLVDLLLPKPVTINNIVNRNYISTSRYTGNVEDYTCSICMNIYTCPVKLTCGHIFCFDCMKKCRSSAIQFNCPMCRASITNFSLDQSTKDKVEELYVRCFNDECRVNLKKKHYAEHIENCLYNKGSCEKCGEIIYVHKDSHDDVCSKSLIKCEKCESFIQRENMHNHINSQCFMRRKLCPFEGCTRIVEYYKLQSHRMTCINRYIQCHFRCGSVVQFKNRYRHYDICCNKSI